MNVEIAQKIATPPTEVSNEATQTQAPKGTDFREHLHKTGDPSEMQANSNLNATPPAATNGVDKTNSTQRVNGAQIPDQQDLFSHFDNLRKEYDTFLQRNSEVDKMVADGKLKPNDPKVVQQHREEMRFLMHMQSEMQSSSMKIEIVSKVVEHATSGVKTVLSTQA